MLSVPSFSSVSEILALLSCISSNQPLKQQVLSKLAPSLEHTLGLSYPTTKDVSKSINVSLPQKLPQQNFNGALSLGLLQTQVFQPNSSVAHSNLNLSSYVPLKRPNILLYQNPQAVQYNSLLADYLKTSEMPKKAEPKSLSTIERENIPNNTDTAIIPEQQKDQSSKLKKKRVQESFKRDTEPRRTLRKFELEVPAKSRVTQRGDPNNRYPIRNKARDKLAEKEEAKKNSQNFEFNDKASEINITIPNHMEKKDSQSYTSNLNVCSEGLGQVPHSQVDEDSQAATPELGSESFHRSIKGLWNPEKISESQLTFFYHSLVHYIGEDFKEHTRALNLLERFEYNVERTLENVRKNKTYYRKQLGLEGNKYHVY